MDSTTAFLIGWTGLVGFLILLITYLRLRYPYEFKKAAP
jgi:hypothetical protein